MTRRRHRRSRGHRAGKRSEIAAARHVDPDAWGIFQGCARKRRFETAEAAYRALVAGSEVGLRRAYSCRFCGGFHLTSQERRSV